MYLVDTNVWLERLLDREKAGREARISFRKMTRSSALVTVSISVFVPRMRRARWTFPSSK